MSGCNLFELSIACASSVWISKMGGLSFSLVQRVFTVEHYLTSRYVCRADFLGKLHDSVVPDKSPIFYLIKRYRLIGSVPVDL